MKAILLERYGPPDELVVAVVERPVPAAGEVLVRVQAAAVNDWDWVMVRGTPFYIRLICGLRRPKVRIPGVDVAGVVEAVGRGVRRFEVGDAVFGDLSDAGFGAFAEYVAAPERALSPKPDELSFLDAAAIPHAAALALQGLELGRMRPGQQVLINGAGGGVGTYAVQIARAIGDVETTGVDSDAKLALMREVGFDHVIDYAEHDFTALGQRYDLILDTRTNRWPTRYCRALKPGGRYVTVGGDAGRLIQILALGRVIRWVTGKEVKLLPLRPNEGLDRIHDLIRAGKLRSITDGPYSLEQVPTAIADFGAARHKGKVVVAIGGAAAAASREPS